MGRERTPCNQRMDQERGRIGIPSFGIDKTLPMDVNKKEPESEICKQVHDPR